ncbi:MAG: ATP-dependent DNA helicase [Lachnospiraceae bacterium]|nr:ATP-dependent DNA helicase [Lachnospiraceae bacterium]
METSREQIKISVRNLVEFILRSGDIDNRHHASSETAMQDGSRIHRMIQKQMGPDYQAEVTLRYTHVTENYDLVVEGRADGIIDTPKEKVIDEIKGTYRELFRMKEANPVHLAQAKCYAYIYALQKEISVIQVRMTYCHLETEEIRYFTSEYTFEELKKWFEGVLQEYVKWADYEYQWKQTRNESIRQVQFPFPYREGQKELVTYVYQTIYHKRKLFLEAPTGVGKTISTVFPAIKAMEKGMGDKLFYLTAKTITRTVAEQTFEILRQQGLQLKSVILTAKDKICFMEETQCNPEHCPYAKGHFDRINEAMYDLLTHEDSFSREKIEEYAHKHKVCPFEFCLDMSLYADAIIGDYNYLFDPHVYLKRFFGENSSKNYVFLIDEAHNLLERGREMYSATLLKEEFLELKRILQDGADDIEAQKENHGVSHKTVLFGQGYAYAMIKQLEKCNKEMLVLKKECEDCRILDSVERLILPLGRLREKMESYLEESEDGEVPEKEPLLDLYFKIKHFLEIYELVDDKYVKYSQRSENGDFLVKLFCVDPSTNLKECMQKGRSSVLFSATFLPIQYYKTLLGGEEKDYEVYANSVFDPEKRGLFVANDVTSKYTRRSEEEFMKIAKYIQQIVTKRHGNYMVFCPSYAFLEEVYQVFAEYFATEEMDCVLQSDIMNEADREEFLHLFEGNVELDIENALNFDVSYEEDRYLIGFCVLGGIFSEGIDLKHDSLIGAIVIGTGLPQVCFEREILKNYFDDNGGNGFDYAYRFPGMNKVLQAAGRVIRTSDDVGIIALLDERFLQNSYIRLFPREWENYQEVGLATIEKKVERFWDSWL